MIYLDKLLRTKLEQAVREARELAERAARAALEQLGVGEAMPYGGLTGEERELRRRLRVHGRQVGDIRDPKTETQEISRLVEETAYRHWHRMLFARFLAENNLLMYPDREQPVPITLEESKELAAAEGYRDGWEMAAKCAERMLPQIFGRETPVLELRFPAELQQKLEKLLEALPVEIFTAGDSLGWVYQFWQAKRKEEVNAAETKMGAREIPAVTQLFTEPYMVQFLLDNSIGAWWAARRLSKEDFANAAGEAELREKAAVPGVPLTYLRFVRKPGQSWEPAAGTFPYWPSNLSDIKVLDPCCGSGHFLVEAFIMMEALRREQEGLTPRQAADAVLSDNLHGLELDRRCVEIAAFNLAMAAWRRPGAGGYRPLPGLQLACTGISVGAAKEEWKALALDKQNLRLALDWMYDEFQNAPILGSLINPAKSQAAKIWDWETLAPLLAEAMERERGDEAREVGVAAQGLAKAAQLLAGQYHWVITNVPYLAIRKQDDILRKFCEENYDSHYKEGRHDLATVFLRRCLDFCREGGNVSVVLPQNWLFLTSYRKFRERLLKEETFNIIARLGPGAFETISGEVVKAILLIISKGNHNITPGLFGQMQTDNGNLIRGLDVSASRTTVEKAQQLLTTEIHEVEQEKQLENPDARIMLDISEKLSLLSNYAECYAGILNGDSPRFQKKYWEIPERGEFWTYQQTTVEHSISFGGLELILYFDKKNGHLREEKWIRKERLHDSDQRGNHAWGHWGVGISQMNEMPISLYTGETFDSNIAVIYPRDQNLILPIWAYCQSEKYHTEIRRIDQKLNVTNATLVKVPFDLDYWQKEAAEKYPGGLPLPYSDDPTQWIFHGHPAYSTDPLQVAVARLLGYRWPAETDPKMELAPQARTLVKKCEALQEYADKDGIVSLTPVSRELPAAERLHNLLAAAYGENWTPTKLQELLKNANHEGQTLDTWLRDKFFTQHCKLFLHRPFIWHIWDGLNDGFSALVNYHRFDRKNLETLIYRYISDWITQCKSQRAGGIDGAEERLAAAENLKTKLELILEGEAPYDIFVRWKPPDRQPLGWDPDLNDGVRLNIRPLMTVPPVGKKEAGVLRDKPNIHWQKDRGKDVETGPWNSEFKGERINDHHLTLAEKRAARRYLV